MIRKLVLGFVVLFGMMSCSNNDDNGAYNLSGIFTETLPVNGRSQLNFINENTVIKTESGSTFQDEFTYELTGDVLKLTPNWVDSEGTEFEIQITNRSKFEIENLYPSIPENTITYMTFEQ